MLAFRVFVRVSGIGWKMKPAYDMHHRMLFLSGLYCDREKKYKEE